MLNFNLQPDMYMPKCLILIIWLFLSLWANGQTVGVVLSGGGALGVAHVGVLKALEENGIPIDYIAGTSMGALVGGLYAMGYAPAQIEALMTSESFRKMVNGKLDDKHIYHYRVSRPNASWATFNFRIDSVIQPKLPSNLVSTLSMDYAIIEAASQITLSLGQDFDSLFVPFRCVAADIYNKAQVIFSKGNLGLAIRASATYPFYYPAVKVDGQLLFDGGLYNNFPADVMYRDFLPDFIIGSTVASEQLPPDEENVYSQIKNMLMVRQAYDEVCENNNMIIIRPRVKGVSILDFSTSDKVIEIGYDAAIARIDEILVSISRRADPDSIARRRMLFRTNIKPLQLEHIQIEGVGEPQKKYYEALFNKHSLRKGPIAINEAYHRVGLDDNTLRIFPEFIKSEKGNGLKMNVKQNKNLQIGFGGLLSSRPINTGFVNINYRYLRRWSLNADVNSYFGKFYSSGMLRTRFFYPWVVPLSLDLDFTLNNYNFFRSLSSFFEEVKPSYLIQFEQNFNALLFVPAGRKGKIGAGLTLSRLVDEYYQVSNFSPGDTSDFTRFIHQSFRAVYESNSLNRKFYPSAGYFNRISYRYFTGKEIYLPGTTALSTEIARKEHEFYRLRMQHESYWKLFRGLIVGIAAEGVLANQPAFTNYTATLLQTPAFSPVPEMRTLFLENYRAFQYAAGGGRLIAQMSSQIELRLDAHAFQPWQRIQRGLQQEVLLSEKLPRPSFVGSASVVWHTPIAPVALSVNYFERENNPWGFLFTFGYVLFNPRATD